MNADIIKHLSALSSLDESLIFLSENVSGKIVFSTSFGIEDQVITNAIFKNQLNNIEVFTLDTGRLFSETYDVWYKTEARYDKKIKTYYPDALLLENYINENGINAFYDSAELRKQCCNVRKVVPLQRALHGADVWITGLRAEHSPNRTSLDIVQWDESNRLYKFNPLLHWTSEQVRAEVEAKRIPYNLLHDKGFVSIGCQPCTRAISEGEDFRAGRWWWETESKKECGLHK